MGLARLRHLEGAGHQCLSISKNSVNVDHLLWHFGIVPVCYGRVPRRAGYVHASPVIAAPSNVLRDGNASEVLLSEHDSLRINEISNVL